MKKMVLIFTACLISYSLKAQKKSILLVNTLSVARIDEAVVISHTQLEKLLRIKIPGNKIPVFTSGKETIIPSQADDLNQDKKWDEVILLYSFQPNEKVQVQVNFVDSIGTGEPACRPGRLVCRAHAQLAKLNEQKEFVSLNKEEMPASNMPTDFSVTNLPLYQAEGPRWENDKIGFRLYFDIRNGKDIFGKTTARMVMDSVGLPGNNYHEKGWWGMDILKVGNSLGAGALALRVKDKKEKETLVRLGPNVNSTTYELVADGPLRAIFLIHYKGWQIATGGKIDLTEEISITAGQYAYQSKVTLSQNATLVAGIVNLHSQKPTHKNTGKFSVIATHDRQSENNDYLGLAIMVNNQSFSGFGETQKTGIEEIQNTYYVAMKAKAGLPVSYLFYGCWQATDERFKDETFFLKFLHQEAVKLSNPVIIRRSK